jgi:hypothetical protein
LTSDKNLTLLFDRTGDGSIIFGPNVHAGEESPEKVCGHIC